ncbi:MAG: APC family permease [Longimicrobiales bacterium]
MGNRTGLTREIGIFDATMIVISGVIGGGIFFTPAVVAQHLPDGRWILAVWVLGAVIAIAGALTFAELAARYPQAGGHYVYIREAFGSLPAFLYGWMLLLIIATGALASLALAFAGYVASFVPLSPLLQKLVAVVIVVLLSALNLLGLKPGTRANTTLTIIKVGAFAAMIGMGLLVDAQATSMTAPELEDVGLLVGFGAALVPVLFSYGGWQQLNFMAGEVRAPERRVPRALLLGVGLVALVYIGGNIVYLRALGPQGMAGSGALARDASLALFGETAGRIVTALVAISILAFSNVVVMATPRVFYALANDGVFLRSLAQLHPRFGTPARAIMLQGTWTVVLILVGNIGALVNGVVFADWIFFGLGAASIFMVRKRMGVTDVSGVTGVTGVSGTRGAAGMFRVPGYPWVPLFFVLAALAAVSSAIRQYPLESLVGGLLLGVGAGLHSVQTRRASAIAS